MLLTSAARVRLFACRGRVSATQPPRRPLSSSFSPSLLPPLCPSAVRASWLPLSSSSSLLLRVGCRGFAAGGRPRGSRPSFSPSASPSAAEPRRLLFATTLRLYARGVPYLYLLLIMPAVSYVIYLSYPPTSLSSLASLLPLTLLPLSLLLVFGLFVRFNRRLISTIHLLPHRRLALTTLNMLAPSPPIVLPLDALLPPFAYSGAADRSLERLRFCLPDGSASTFFIHPLPNSAEDADADLLHAILTHNRIDNQQLRV